jgi:group I intron endonuclease
MNNIIYICCSPSGKVYIGKTVKSFEERKREHLNNAFNENHACYDTKFFRAIRKYRDELEWSVLHENVENLNELEKEEIRKHDSFKSGYNSTLGGEGSLGREWRKETLELISQKAKERFKNKANHPMFGKTHSKEAKEKMSKADRETSEKSLTNLEKGRSLKAIFKVKTPEGIIEIEGQSALKSFLDSKDSSFWSLLKYGHSKGYELVERGHK